MKQTVKGILYSCLLIIVVIGQCVWAQFDTKAFFSDAQQAMILERFGDDAVKRVVEWQAMIESSLALAEPDKLQAVNQFFNQLQFKSDYQVWKKSDYWATPVEFTSIGAGDCEDFSIAKYFTLKIMGVDEKKIRITYVKAIKLNQAHMVLAYYPTPSAIPLVLDNLDPEIKPGNARTDLVPIYSFNGQGLWLAKERGKGKRLGESSEMELWNDLSKRMQQGL